MPCEQFKEALIETAISGAEPQGELRTHLNACASCRGVFAKEQSLFSAIDLGIQAAANAKVPPSLLPRVRAALDEVPVTSPSWSFGWMVITGAAVASAVLFVTLTIRQNALRERPDDSAASRPPAPEIARPAPGVPSFATPGNNHSYQLPSVAFAPNSPLPEGTATAKSTLEVLVPQDDEVALASYAQQWSSHKRPPLVAGDPSQTTVALLEVSPIQIPELDVKPLAEGNSQ